MNYRTVEDMNQTIKYNLGLIQQLDVDLIVGVPRSGMIPAYLIALLLNKHCCTVKDLLENQPFQHGRTRKVDELRNPKEANRILLVDDSVNSGKSILEEIEKIYAHNINIEVLSLCIYSATKKNKSVDYYLEYVPTPRFFEWNLFHQNITSESCIDIDGVLCEDPAPSVNDDGDEYREFLLNAKPLYIPTRKVKYLVTNRLEKYREETVYWLKKHNVKYEKLIMLNLQTKQERQELKSYSKNKWKIYKQSNASLFIESDDKQAQEIFRLSKKPVYCVETNQLYSKNELFNIVTGTEISRKHFKSRVFNKMPQSMKTMVRKLLKK